MASRNRNLDIVIWAALKRAVAENRLDVAECLLRALELLEESPQ